VPQRAKTTHEKGHIPNPGKGDSPATHLKVCAEGGSWRGGGGRGVVLGGGWKKKLDGAMRLKSAGKGNWDLLSKKGDEKKRGEGTAE